MFTKVHMFLAKLRIFFTLQDKCQATQGFWRVLICRISSDDMNGSIKISTDVDYPDKPRILTANKHTNKRLTPHTQTFWLYKKFWNNIDRKKLHKIIHPSTPDTTPVKLTHAQFGDFICNTLNIHPDNCLEIDLNTGHYDTRQLMLRPDTDLMMINVHQVRG